MTEFFGVRVYQRWCPAKCATEEKRGFSNSAGRTIETSILMVGNDQICVLQDRLAVVGRTLRIVDEAVDPVAHLAVPIAELFVQLVAAQEAVFLERDESRPVNRHVPAARGARHGL